MMFFINKKKLLLVSFMVCISIAFFYSFTTYSFLTSGNQTGKMVIVDPGHGGEDGGAVGKSGTLEKDLNLVISLKLRDFLISEGYQVIMTREVDKSLHSEDAKNNKKRSDLNNRVYLSRNYPEAVFVSIHMNSYEKSPQKGSQVFYSKNNPNSKTLGEIIQDTLKTEVDPENRRLAKQAENNIFLMKEIKNTACLVECGFVSHADEEALLKTNEYQEKIARAIAEGIKKFHSVP